MCVILYRSFRNGTRKENIIPIHFSLKFVGHYFHLLIGEHRTVFAYIGASDIAPAAFSEATLHPHLEGGNDIAICKTQLQE